MNSKKQTATREGSTSDEEIDRKLIRVPREVFAKVKIGAKRARRSVNSEIVCAIEAFYEVRK